MLTEQQAARAAQPVAPRFNLADADQAHEEWGANCGPAALAAIMGMTLDEVRPHMGDFESRGYTNPTLMLYALKKVRARFRTRSLASNVKLLGWPVYGLAYIQWEGPWTKPGVPMAARYHHTHWVGAARHNSEIGIFDVNCINNGSGWVSLQVWQAIAVPWILSECVPRASGKWHIANTIEIEQSTKGRA